MYSIFDTWYMCHRWPLFARLDKWSSPMSILSRLFHFQPDTFVFLTKMQEEKRPYIWHCVYVCKSFMVWHQWFQQAYIILLSCHQQYNAIEEHPLDFLLIARSLVGSISQCAIQSLAPPPTHPTQPPACPHSMTLRLICIKDLIRVSTSVYPPSLSSNILNI